MIMVAVEGRDGLLLTTQTLSDVAKPSNDRNGGLRFVLFCLLVFVTIIQLFEHTVWDRYTYNSVLRPVISQIKDTPIIYVIRSQPKYYSTRLEWQRETWMTLLTQQDRVLVATVSGNEEKRKSF